MAAIAAAAIAAGGSAYSIIQGAKAKSEANQAAASAAQSIAQMQEADKFRNLQVPTLGLEMAQQNIQARQAQQLQGLQDIGAAGVLGGLTALNQQGQAQDLALAAQAQEAQYARDIAQAQNAQAIEQRRMAREAGLEQQRLTGAQAASAYGQQQINAGIQGLAQTAGNVLVQSLKDKPLFEGKDKLGTGGKTPPAKTPAVAAPATAAQTPTITTLTGEQIQQNAQSAFAPQVNSMLPTGMQALTPEVAGGLGLTSQNVITPQINTIPKMADKAEFRRIFEEEMNKEMTDAEMEEFRKQNDIKMSKDPSMVKRMLEGGYKFNPTTQRFERIIPLEMDFDINSPTFGQSKEIR